MGSLEDLRDNYKTLKQSSDFMLELNGATYRNAHFKKRTSNGNLLTKRNSNDANRENQLDKKYMINSRDVDYSLNKKGRWKMAKELVERMSEFENDNLDVRVQETCYRRKKLSSNLISYNKSKGDKISIKSAYANYNSIMKSQHLQELKEFMKEASESDQFKDKNHIVIDVDAEMKAKEKIKHESYDEYKFEYAPHLNIIKHKTKHFSKSQGKKTSATKKNRMSIEKDNDYEVYDFDEEYQSNVDDTFDETEHGHILDFNDLIQTYAKPIIEKRYFEKKLNSLGDVDDSFKSHIVYLNEKITKFTRQKSHRQVNYSKDLNCILRNFEITPNSFNPETLKIKFSCERYQEAINVYPRIITINMVKDIREKLELSKDKCDLNVWLVLRHKPLENLYELMIKTNFKIDDHLDLIDEHDFAQIYDNILSMLAKNIDKKLFTIKNNQSIESLDVKFLYISNLSETKELHELKSELIQVKTEINSDKIFTEPLLIDMFSCELCFDAHLNTDQVIILKGCDHKVCLSCIKNYIDYQLNNSFSTAGRLLCPVCDYELDLVLIIAFASDINKLEIFLRLSIERILFELRSYKWCANPKCNKALKLDMTTNLFGLVTCECGHVVCLKCNQAPHFPAKCNQIAKYHEKLKTEGIVNNRQRNDEIFQTKGKRCPKCQTFIEKNDGCNSMICVVCKEQFCWDCLRVWTEHLKLTNGQHNCISKFTKTQHFVKLEFKTKRKKFIEEDKLHAKSIEHRQARCNANKIKQIVLRFLSTIKHKDLVGEDSALSFDEQCKEQLDKLETMRQEINKIANFLNELHFVCEHGYLLLDDDNLSSTKQLSLQRILASLELIIWKIKSILDYGKGLDVVDELRDLHDKGLNCLKKLNCSALVDSNV